MRYNTCQTRARRPTDVAPSIRFAHEFDICLRLRISYANKKACTRVMLDAPKKKVVNDAARARGRVADLDIKAVTPETLTELLDLRGMRVEGFAVEEQEGREYLHLFCQHCHEVAICPRCGEATAEGYDSEDRSVRHLDIWGIR